MTSQMQRMITNLMDIIKNIGLKLLFQSSFLIHLVFQRLYGWIISLTTIASLLGPMICINLNLIYYFYPARIFSVHWIKEVDWKLTLKWGYQTYVFDNILNKSISARCTVMLNFLPVTDENQNPRVFPVLPFNILQY